MAKSKIADLYANRAFERVTCSAADTLTFSQIQFGTGLFQGVAIVLSRVEMHPTPSTQGLLNATGDAIEMAITNRDDLADLQPDNQSVLCRKNFRFNASGTPAVLVEVDTPWIMDYSNLGGGGLIIPANPIYAAVDSLSLGTAAVVDFILYFTFKQLTDAEYIELLQTIMPANL